MDTYRTAPGEPTLDDLLAEQEDADQEMCRAYLSAGLLPLLTSRGVTPRMRARLDAGEPYDEVMRALRPGYEPMFQDRRR